MKRIITGTIFGLLLVGTILLRNVSLIFFDVFLGAAILLANLELCNALTKRNRYNIKYISLIHAVLFYVITLLTVKLNLSFVDFILYQLYLILAVVFVTFITALCISFIKNKRLNKKRKGIKP